MHVLNFAIFCMTGIKMKKHKFTMLLFFLNLKHYTTACRTESHFNSYKYFYKHAVSSSNLINLYKKWLKLRIWYQRGELSVLPFEAWSLSRWVPHCSLPHGRSPSRISVSSKSSANTWKHNMQRSQNKLDISKNSS